ncbi:52818ef2-f754-4755-9c8a-6681f7e93dee [Sclerotinia trifoliorum]|uniref:Stress-associated endoplasmic reticulum protein n=1 Tax=Sclerotinia trifoliorum TaxID=28548 RepID=A0A8H2ZMC5_9HELO|nr:52818ef2-f754-4755-9c8a-6681f7e93dee [Sclerotinia trifoliorum]
MVQTPTQRKANLKFAAINENKQGKSEAQLHKKELKKQKSPVSKGWLYLLAFILIGGFFVDAIFRLVSYFSSK